MIPCRLSTDYHDEKYTNDLNHTEIKTRLKIKMIKLQDFFSEGTLSILILY